MLSCKSLPYCIAAAVLLLGVLISPLYSGDTPDDDPKIFSTVVDEIDVKIFVPERVEVFRGAWAFANHSLVPTLRVGT